MIRRVNSDVTGDANPVTAALATAYQALDLAFELLVHKNVNKWIDRGIARDQNDRSNVGDVSVVLRRTEVVQCVDG